MEHACIIQSHNQRWIIHLHNSCLQMTWFGLLLKFLTHLFNVDFLVPLRRGAFRVPSWTFLLISRIKSFKWQCVVGYAGKGVQHWAKGIKIKKVLLIPLDLWGRKNTRGIDSTRSAHDCFAESIVQFDIIYRQNFGSRLEGIPDHEEEE